MDLPNLTATSFLGNMSGSLESLLTSAENPLAEATKCDDLKRESTDTLISDLALLTPFTHAPVGLKSRNIYNVDTC